MAFVAKDKNGEEWVYDVKPERYSDNNIWYAANSNFCDLPSGTIKKLIGRDLTFDDDPVELT